MFWGMIWEEEEEEEIILGHLIIVTNLGFEIPFYWQAS